MAIDCREDGDWVVGTDEKGCIVQTRLGTNFQVVTEPRDINNIKDFGARTAAQIQHCLRQG